MELLNEAKQFLSIVETSTLKDDEINSLIEAGILELTRSGIDIEYNSTIDEESETITDYDNLIKTTIMMFVKANFGNVDVKEKELANRAFNSLEQSLSQSEGYRLESDD